MSELVERLKAFADDEGCLDSAILREAAQRIEELEATNNDLALHLDKTVELAAREVTDAASLRVRLAAIQKAAEPIARSWIVEQVDAYPDNDQLVGPTYAGNRMWPALTVADLRALARALDEGQNVSPPSPEDEGE